MPSPPLMKEECIEDDEFDENELNEEYYCYAYYKNEFKDVRNQIVKSIFRDLTGKWSRNFVIYPLSSIEDI